MPSIWISILILFGFLFAWLIRSVYRQRNLPHGPMPLPFFGNLLSLRNDPHATLDKYAEFYGPVFTLWFGKKPIVLVNDYNGALDVFSKNGLKFSSRPNFISRLLTKNNERFPFMNYCSKFIRNQTLCMKACDVDGKYLEECVRSVSMHFCDRIESQLSVNDFDPSDDIGECVMKLMSKIVYGIESDIRFSDINLPGNEDLLTIANTTTEFPLIRLLNFRKYLKYKAYMKKRDRICKSIFRQSMEYGDKDAMASMIVSSLNEHFKEVAVMESEILASDLFVLGSEDLGAAFKWLLLYFINWPEIQFKVQEELDNARKESDTYFTVAEAMDVPYLQATVCETLRLSSLNPLSTIHVSTDCVTLRGYKLPKDTYVCVNLNAIHHSLKYWDNPHEFNPSRFLDWNLGGKKMRDLDTIKGYLPFGSGVRKCVAENLSMKLLTSVMANLLYNFHFDVSPWNLKPGLSHNTAKLLSVPNSYQVRVSKR